MGGGENQGWSGGRCHEQQPGDSVLWMACGVVDRLFSRGDVFW